MELIADGMLIAAAGTAALYCWILSRRLNDLKSLDKGLGGAIASLSAQVEETRAALAEAKLTTQERSRELGDMTARAEMVAGRLEMSLAKVHEGERSKRVDPAKVYAARAQKPGEKAKADEDNLLQALKGLTEVVNS